MALTLYNSMSRRIEEFTPADPGQVTMYVCGPTVYNDPHIGNARPFVVFDVLYRLLRRRYPTVRYARNITDVDDKIITAADNEGTTIEKIARRYEDVFLTDMDALGVLPPSSEPHATEHIPHMIAMIEQLERKGFAYRAEGHVLFEVAKFSSYGSLSRASSEERRAGARVEVASYKRAPEDFVLWKPASFDEPGWESPYGRGRPGWHLECSAMSAAHLDTTIDIHGGGCDLLFPHHENEIAQSEAAHGKPLARFWVHNGFVTVEGQKMSKSVGNVLTISHLRRKWRPEVLRYVLLGAHYRQPLDWSETALENAERTLDRLYGTLDRLAGHADHRQSDVPDSIESALNDDLNTPRAFAALSELASEANRKPGPENRAALLAAGGALGLLQQSPEDWLRSIPTELTAAEIDQLIEQRVAARKAKDFARADAIRDELEKAGITLEDAGKTTRWRRAS